MFSDPQELKTAFGLGAEYEKYTMLNDVPVGFSIQRRYPDNCGFKSAFDKEQKPDTYQLVHVVYSPIESTGDTPKVPLHIDVNRHSRYLARHFDYDYNDPECPTPESVRDSRASLQPLNISSHDEYFYDHERKCFTDSQNECLSGADVLDRLLDIHLSTTKAVSGLLLRWKIATHARSVSWFDLVAKIVKEILGRAFGRTVVEPDTYSAMLQGYGRESLRLVTEDSMSILGFRASKNAVVIFGLTGLVSSAAYVWIGSPFHGVNRLFGNTLFGLFFSISALWFLDGPAVQALRLMLNLAIRLQRRTIFRRTNIKKTVGLYH
jgi:hypothetical protein